MIKRRRLAFSIILVVNVLLSPAWGDEAPSGTGEELYVKCIGCHSPGYNRTGPKHCDLLGRRAGSLETFDYSEAMRASNVVWTKETLDKFLENPLEYLPGTSMGFVGVRNKIERQRIIHYLSTLQCEAENE